jgi:hypothetical protein
MAGRAALESAEGIERAVRDFAAARGGEFPPRPAARRAD